MQEPVARVPQGRTNPSLGHINHKSAILFLVIGGLATALHYLIALVLIHGMSAQPLLASGVGFIASTIFNYLANACYTFDASPNLRNGVRFIVTASAGLVINTLVLGVLLKLFHTSFIIAQISATGVVLLWNYLIHAIWTFHPNPLQDRGPTLR